MKMIQTALKITAARCAHEQKRSFRSAKKGFTFTFLGSLRELIYELKSFSFSIWFYFVRMIYQNKHKRNHYCLQFHWHFFNLKILKSP